MNGKDNVMARSSYLMRSRREVGRMYRMEGSSFVCKCRVGDMHDVAVDTYVWRKAGADGWHWRSFAARADIGRSGRVEWRKYD